MPAPRHVLVEIDKLGLRHDKANVKFKHTQTKEVLITETIKDESLIDISQQTEVILVEDTQKEIETEINQIVEEPVNQIEISSINIKEESLIDDISEQPKIKRGRKAKFDR